MAVLPSSLTYGRVRWQAVAAVADGADTNELPDALPVTGSVTFTPTVSGPLLLIGQSPVTVFPTPVTYQLDPDGVLRDSSGRAEISLVATDAPGLTPQDWTWTARYDLNNSLVRGTFAFYLPSGTTVDLTNVSPVAISNGVQIIQGPAGKDGTGGTGGGAVSSVQGQTGTVFLLPSDIGAASAQALSDGLATKVNSSTYTAGIAGAKDRAQHTGSQLASTISDFASAALAAIPPQIVVHGDNANASRPNTILPVVWFGTVDPVNSDDTKDVTVYIGLEAGAPAQSTTGRVGQATVGTSTIAA